jgi:hypothetical protein
MILAEDLKVIRKVVLSDIQVHQVLISELKFNLFLSNLTLLAKPHLIAVVFDYTQHTLRVRLETDVVGTSLATRGNVDMHKALLTMVNRLEGGAGGFIVRAVLPFGKLSYPCELLMLEPSSSQNDR